MADDGTAGFSLGDAIEQIKADLGLDEELRGKAAVEAAQEDLGLEDEGEALGFRAGLEGQHDLPALARQRVDAVARFVSPKKDDPRMP